MINAYKKLGPFALKSGLADDGGVTTHGLRNTAATRVYELGLSLEVIASIAGQHHRTS
jgi:integrase